MKGLILFDKKKTPREQAKDISEGKEKPHHIGTKNVAVLQQEYFSLINTKEAFRNEEWRETWDQLTKDILELGEGNLILASFESKYGHLGRIPR